MNKSLVIHAVSEAIVLLIVIVVTQRQFKSMKTEMQKLTDRVKKQEEVNDMCMQHIQKLYNIIDSLVARMQRLQLPAPFASPQPQQVPTSAPIQQVVEPMSQPAAASPLQQPIAEPFVLDPTQQIQQSQQQLAQAQAQQHETIIQQQQAILKKQTGPGMIEAVFGMLPTMMGAMSSINPAQVIITELEQPQPKAPTQDPQAQVEVYNEEEDPDVLEALRE